MQGNHFEICGASHGDVTMRDLISAQMDGVYFPVTIHEFAADITYRDLNEGEFDDRRVSVKTMLLSHPGNCLGYRVELRRAVDLLRDRQRALRPGLRDYVRGVHRPARSTSCTRPTC